MKPRLLWSVFSTEARKHMSYRTDFWINSLGGIAVNFSVYWFLAHALFAASGASTLGGYTPRGMVLYYVFAILMGRMVQSNEMEMGTSQDIYDGSLSRYLLYPVSYPAMKYAEQAGALAPQMVQMTLFAVVAPLAVGIPEEVRITPASVAMSLVSLGVANLLHYLLLLPIQQVAFWAENVWSLVVAERFTMSLLGGMLLPLDLFPNWAREILYWLPFPYLYSVPVRTVMGRLTVMDWASALVIAAAWCGVAAVLGRLVWRRGDLQYTGVGL